MKRLSVLPLVAIALPWSAFAPDQKPVDFARFIEDVRRLRARWLDDVH